MQASVRIVCALLSLTAAGAAHAHGSTRCERVPAADKRPQMELQKKLADDGWKVRQVKNTNDCYEVYGFDPRGARVEAFFDPKTFARVDETEPDTKK